VTAGVIVAGGGTFGVFWFRRWQRNRFRIPASEAAHLIETSPEPPIIVDARSEDTYTKSPVQLPRSIHVPPDHLADAERTREIDRERIVIAYCT
jgi:rhodanese-related sulfurtransferase